MSERAEDDIELPAALSSMRRFALDDALLLFDRRTGLTALCDGPETIGLRMRAPRVVQFAITNACNLACTFCSRDASAASGWSADEAFSLLRDLDARGTLEVAFGGGEPLAFKGFAPLVRRLSEETSLAVSLTTNGALLTDAMAEALAPFVGQVRVSVYDDIDHRPTLARLAARRVRYGVNWLVTPGRLASVEAFVLDLAGRGCRDVLLLSYNGRDASMHLSREESDALAGRVRRLSRALGGLHHRRALCRRGHRRGGRAAAAAGQRRPRRVALRTPVGGGGPGAPRRVGSGAGASRCEARPRRRVALPRRQAHGGRARPSGGGPRAVHRHPPDGVR